MLTLEIRQCKVPYGSVDLLPAQYSVQVSTDLQVVVVGIPYINSIDKIAIYGPMSHSAPVRNVFYACISITRGSGKGLDPGNQDFFGPCEMASSRGLS